MFPLVKKSKKLAHFFMEKPVAFSLENAETLSNYNIRVEDSIQKTISKEDDIKKQLNLFKNMRKMQIFPLFSPSNQRKILKSLSISFKNVLSFRREGDFSSFLKSKVFYFFPKENPSYMNLSPEDQESFVEIIKEKPLKKRLFYYSRLFKSPETLIKKPFPILPEDLAVLKKDKQVFLRNIKISLLLLEEKELISLIKSLTFEDLRRIKRKKLVYLLVFISKQVSKGKFNEFFFNLSLLNRPLLNVKSLVYIEKKIRDSDNVFQEFFKKELATITKKITASLKKKQTDAICNKKLMKRLKRISSLLTNEFYVLKFYKNLLAIVRPLMLYRGDINKKMSLRTSFYRICICKSLNIRLNIKVYEDILSVLDKNPLKLEYFMVKAKGKIIDLLVEKEEVKAEILRKIIEKTIKLSQYGDILGIRNQINGCKIDLLVYSVVLHRVCFTSDQWMLLIRQILQDLLEKEKFSFTQEQLRSLKYFFFNSLILLKSMNEEKKNKNHEEFLEFLEKWNKTLLFPINLAMELEASSRAEKELLPFLKQHQNIVKTNYYIGCFRVDFYLPSTKTIVEYQGLQHFFLETEKKKKDIMPKDLLKKEILTLMGYKVLFVSCWEWKKLRNDQDRAFFIRNLLGNQRKFSNMTREAHSRIKKNREK